MLPLELRVCIAECCPVAWYRLCCVDKEMWLYYKEYPRAYNELVEKFTKTVIVRFPNRVEKFGLLPCGWLHGYVYRKFYSSRDWDTICLFKCNKMIKGYISFNATDMVTFERNMLHGCVDVYCGIFSIAASMSMGLIYENDKLVRFTKRLRDGTETNHTTLEDLTEKEKYHLDRVIGEWETYYKFLTK